MCPFQEFDRGGEVQRARYRSLDREAQAPARTKEECKQVLKLVKTRFKDHGFRLRFKFALLDFSYRIKTIFSFGLARQSLVQSRMMLISFVYKLLKSPILPKIPASLSRALNRSQMKLLLAIMKALQEHRDFAAREHKRNNVRAMIVGGARVSSVDVALIPDIAYQIDHDLLYYKQKTSEARLKCSSAWADLELERILHDVSEQKRSAQELWEK